MINYKDDAIVTPFTEVEINETVCRLLAFCRINKGSKQVKKLGKQLEDLEDAIANGEFKN